MYLEGIVMTFSSGKLKINPHPLIPAPRLGGREITEKQVFASVDLSTTLRFAQDLVKPVIGRRSFLWLRLILLFLWGLAPIYPH